MSQLRVLCLHGQQTSAEILEWQLRRLSSSRPFHAAADSEPGPLADSLRDALDMTLVCVDGLIETEPHPSFCGIFEPPFYDWIRWAKPDQFSQSHIKEESIIIVTRALEYLDDIVNDKGPFDGIFGFSQGASVACSYLLYLSHQNGSCTPFRFALFFSSGGLSEQHMAILARATLPAADTEAMSQKLSIPSLHVYGSADELKAEAEAMTRIWESGSTVIETHAGGHVIPRDARSVARITSSAKTMMLKVAL